MSKDYRAILENDGKIALPSEIIKNLKIKIGDAVIFQEIKLGEKYHYYLSNSIDYIRYDF